METATKIRREDFEKVRLSHLSEIEIEMRELFCREASLMTSQSMFRSLFLSLSHSLVSKARCHFILGSVSTSLYCWCCKYRVNLISPNAVRI